MGLAMDPDPMSVVQVTRVGEKERRKKEKRVELVRYVHASVYAGRKTNTTTLSFRLLLRLGDNCWYPRYALRSRSRLRSFSKVAGERSSSAGDCERRIGFGETGCLLSTSCSLSFN